MLKYAIASLLGLSTAVGVTVGNQPGGYFSGDGVPLGDIDLNGAHKLIIDVDADTYIFADSTDDYISFFAGASQRAIITNSGIVIPDSRFLNFGTSVDYWMDYNAAGSQLELWSTTGGGGTTDALLLSFDDTTNDADFGGTVVAAGGFDASNQDLSNVDIVYVENDGYITNATARGVFVLRMTSQTNDPFALLTGSNNNTLLIAEYGDVAVDFAHAVQTNPTIFIQSADGTTVADWGSFAHDQTNFVIASGSGAIKLDGAAAVIMDVQTAASVSEPVACGATTVGTFQYVNDSDDGAAAEVCICAGITNDATYDWVQMKDMTTACTFF